MVWLIPDKGGELMAQHDMDRLEERFLQHPALAIEQSRLVTDSMAEKARGNLLHAMGLRGAYSDKGYEQVDETEQLIDRYEDKLGTYLMKLTARSLSPEQTEEVAKYLHTISDFERISDHACNVADVCQEIDEKKVEFSPSALHELEVLEGAVTEILSISVDAFIEGNLAAGRPCGAAGGDHRRIVRRDEIPPCGSSPAGRLHAEPGLCVQRSADQL